MMHHHAMPAVTKVSISLQSELHRRAAARAKAQHRSFSGHVAHLLDQDLIAATHLAHAAAAEHAADVAARRHRPAKHPLPRP